jgi:tetratricopeptide (TPR) repeat protein
VSNRVGGATFLHVNARDASDKAGTGLGRAALMLLVLVAAVYLPGALQNGWAVDDTRFILENPHVLEPNGAAGWLAFLHDPHTVDPESPGGIVRPLRTLEFALDHAVFGLSPIAFHLHTLAWHLLGSVLVLLLLQRLVGATAPALVGAAVWALHPMQVEAVAWVSSRGDVAMGACTIGALVLELCSKGRDRWLAGALLCGALAMLYKETAVVLPLLVFAVRLVHPRSGPPGGIAGALLAAVPYAVLAAVYLVYRGSVQVGDTAHTSTFVLGGSTAGTFSTMFRAIGAYVTMALLPVRPDYDWYLNPSTSLLAPSALAWLAVLVALVVTAVRLRARTPLAAAAISLFLFPLIPVANWPFALGIPTSERFLYLSLLGVAVLVAAASRRGVLRAAATVAALAMAAISFDRTHDWQDDTTLLRTALRHDTSPRARAWFAAKEREAGLALDRQAAKSADTREKERLQGEALSRYESALDHAHRAIDLWHRFEKVTHVTSDVVTNPHINAANVALFLDRPGEALWHADRVLIIEPDRFPQPHYNRGMALLALGRPAEAVGAFEHALRLGTRRDDRVLQRRILTAGRACREAGAYEAARRAYRLVRTERPEATSRGLAEVDDAQREHASDSPIGLARRAAAGAELSGVERQALPAGPLRQLALGCSAERRGDDREAVPHLRRALESGELPTDLRERAASAVTRIEAGCAAWRDHGPRAAPE